MDQGLKQVHKVSTSQTTPWSHDGHMIVLRMERNYLLSAFYPCAILVKTHKLSIILTDTGVFLVDLFNIITKLIIHIIAYDRTHFVAIII